MNCVPKCTLYFQVMFLLSRLCLPPMSASILCAVSPKNWKDMYFVAPHSIRIINQTGRMNLKKRCLTGLKMIQVVISGRVLFLKTGNRFLSAWYPITLIKVVSAVMVIIMTRRKVLLKDMAQKTASDSKAATWPASTPLPFLYQRRSLGSEGILLLSFSLFLSPQP